jgi:hypothetical protein
MTAPPHSDPDFDDAEIERFSEGLRTYTNHNLTQELSKLYHRMRILNKEEKITPKRNVDRKESIRNDLFSIKRKIGAVEEEIGRRKKNNSWNW